MTDPYPQAGAILQIDLGAIVENWRILCARAGSGRVGAVVKADAYGLGAAPVARALAAVGCTQFFVAHPAEATALRAALAPSHPNAWIAVLNGLPPGLAHEYRAHRLVPVLNDLAGIAAWTQEARIAETALPAVLHIDTGMHRLGLDTADLATLAAQPGLLAGLDIAYNMTHLVAAEQPDDPQNARQLQRFRAACAQLPAALRSIANSSGLFLGPEFAADLARPGAALYGINPTPGQPNPMRPVARLRGRVLQLRDVPAGETVGYNGAWRAPRRSRIATVAVGYADGYPRALTNCGQARFDGRPVPLVGRVSMDLTTFDVTDHPGVQPGAWLDLIGPDNPPDALAQAFGGSGYEILTRLGARYRRVWQNTAPGGAA